MEAAADQSNDRDSMPFHGGFTCHNRRALNRGTPMKTGGGRGRGPDPAKKLRFSNFSNHLRPLGRPMEGHVDFYHTNFFEAESSVPSGFFAAGPDVK